MAEGELKLLGMWASPYVIRVRMVLGQKGLNYEYLEEDLENKSELLLKHNPVSKKVPVLIHGDRSICESFVILQYIDESWSGIGYPVLPIDPYERAMARFWAQYIDEKFFLTFVGIVMPSEDKAEKITSTLAALELFEEAFEKCSGGKVFFGGDSVGFLDVTLGCVLTWIKAVEGVSGVKVLDETKVPLLVQWMDRFLELDFVKSVLPSVERLERHIRHLQVTRWKVTSAE